MNNYRRDDDMYRQQYRGTGEYITEQQQAEQNFYGISEQSTLINAAPFSQFVGDNYGSNPKGGYDVQQQYGGMRQPMDRNKSDETPSI